jgi:outer membrane protein
VKRTVLTATALVFLAGGSYLVHSSWGQDKKGGKEAREADEAPHRVALIDMTYVFQNYEKLEYLKKDLQAKAQEDQNRFNEMRKKIQADQAVLKDLAEGSEDYQKLDRKITQMTSQAEAQYKVWQREMQRENAKLVHTVYLEVQDVIAEFCDHFKFTLVLQINRGEINNADPNKLMQLLNQPVVYHRKQDDLSVGVVKELNQRYLKAGGEVRPSAKSEKKPGGKKSPIKQAGGKDGD